MNKLLTYLTVGIFLLLGNQVKASDKTIGDKDSLNIELQENLQEKYKAIGGNIFLGYGMLKGKIYQIISLTRYLLELMSISIDKDL